MDQEMNVRAKMAKLKEQKRVADEINELLTRPGEDGLNESSRKTMKNLEVAVVVSKRPGFFEYYKPAPEVEAIQKNGEIQHLVKKLNRLGGEIAQLDAESQNIEAMRKPLKMSSGPELTSLAQWNARYGTVEKPVPSGFYSGFNDAPKIYGGTEHHRAFKTQSRTMKRGRLIR
uniref:Uncharacterized protein n=1 Tax=Florenciella parvula TaxID=236787 RepID=A0A7S2FSZ0_9STRA